MARICLGTNETNDPTTKKQTSFVFTHYFVQFLSYHLRFLFTYRLNHNEVPFFGLIFWEKIGVEHKTPYFLGVLNEAPFWTDVFVLGFKDLKHVWNGVAFTNLMLNCLKRWSMHVWIFFFFFFQLEQIQCDLYPKPWLVFK